MTPKENRIRKYKGMFFVCESETPEQKYNGFKYCMAIHFSKIAFEARFTTINQSSIKHMKQYINYLLGVGLYIENIREVSEQYCSQYLKP